MSYHSPIVVQALLAADEAAATQVSTDFGGHCHLHTLFALIRRVTGATSVMVQFDGDAPMPLSVGLECIETRLVRGRRRIGVLRCFAHGFTPEAAALLQDFAKLIVEQNDLWAQAHIDALTGALTRRAFADDLERAVATYQRNDTECSLIMFDLDHFKKINDAYGHLAGDAVLRAVGRLVKRELRASDRFGRLGGEEFGVLVEADVTTATEIAERLRLAISTTVVEGFEQLRFTASMGVAGCDIENDTVMGLMSKADERLYAAKRTGRNRVCTFAARQRAMPLS
jgi:diguanylate cyclase (GGDEF)-like protein